MKKLPFEVRSIPFPDARAVLLYWDDYPPESEMMSRFARVYLKWEPARKGDPNADHKASLEARWKAGAMNAKQLMEAFGGGARAVSVDMNGVARPAPQLPGIGTHG